MIKAILFARVSSEQQQLERQIADLFPLIEGDGYSKDEIAIIQHKESATKNDISNRKSITELKELIENNPIEATYVQEISRLSRRNDVLYQVLSLLGEKKIALVVQKPMLIRTIENGKPNPIADVIISFMSFVAVSEVELKKERQASGYKQKISEGRICTSIIKFGYSRTPDNHAEVNIEQASIINQMFKMYADGLSTASIWQYFEHLNIFKDRNDHRWAKEKDYKSGATSIWHILQDKTYIGQNGHFSYPAIVDEELFNKVNERLKSNKLVKTKLKFVYYCQGLIRWNGKMLTPASARCTYTAEIDRKKYSININVMDSLVKNMACLALSSMSQTDLEKRRSNARKNIEQYKCKVSNIESEIRAKEEEIDRANDMYQQGKYRTKEKYEFAYQKAVGEMEFLKSEKNKLMMTISELNGVVQRGDETIHHMEGVRMYYNLMDVTDDNEIQGMIREAIESVNLERIEKGWKIRIDYKDKSLNIPEEYWMYIQRGCKIRLYHCSDGDDTYEEWTGTWTERIQTSGKRNKGSQK